MRWYFLLKWWFVECWLESLREKLGFAQLGLRCRCLAVPAESLQALRARPRLLLFVRSLLQRGLCFAQLGLRCRCLSVPAESLLAFRLEPRLSPVLFRFVHRLRRPK